MGIEDPAIWVAAVGALGTVGTAIYRLKKAKIQADSTTRIAEMAFKDSVPGDRALILEALSKLRPFHPGSGEPDDDDTTSGVSSVLEQLPRTVRKRRG